VVCWHASTLAKLQESVPRSVTHAKDWFAWQDSNLLGMSRHKTRPYEPSYSDNSGKVRQRTARALFTFQFYIPR